MAVNRDWKLPKIESVDRRTYRKFYSSERKDEGEKKDKQIKGEIRGINVHLIGPPGEQDEESVRGNTEEIVTERKKHSSPCCKNGSLIIWQKNEWKQLPDQ